MQIVISKTKGISNKLITHTTTGAEHLTVSVGEDAEGVVHINATDATELTIDVSLDRNAKLTLLCLQDGKSDTVIRQRSTVGEGASLHVQNITLGSGTVDHDLISEITGAHGESTIDWVFYAKNKEQQTLSARNVFNAKDGGGEITMKGVAEGEANVTCNGMIDIGLAGGGTDAYLTEDVLMLDATAKVDAVPGLEIKTNDVKASHSATVSRVTEEDLFYFGARGINEEIARQMYVEGFLGDLVQNTANEEVHKTILKKLHAA